MSVKSKWSCWGELSHQIYDFKTLFVNSNHNWFITGTIHLAKWINFLAIAWSQTLNRKTNRARTWLHFDILSRYAGIRKITPIDCTFESGRQVNWNICSDNSNDVTRCSRRTFVEWLWQETVFKKCVAKNALEWEYRGRFIRILC